MRSGQSGGEAETWEGLGVEERVDRFDAITAELDHLERPWEVTTVGVDAVLRERRASVGLPGEESRAFAARCPRRRTTR